MQDSFRVVVTGDGRLLSNELPEGTYTVASWRAGEDIREEMRGEPHCNAESPVGGCVTYCTLTTGGDLICEGLSEGQYNLVHADAEELCTLSEDFAQLNCDGLPPVVEDDNDKAAADFLKDKSAAAMRFSLGS